MKQLISLFLIGFSIAALGETHRTRCVVFDRQFKPDGGSFVFEGLKYSSLGQIKEVSGVNLPETMLARLPLGGKNNYMKVLKDDKYSEIIGLHVVFGGQQKDAPNRIELRSYFNKNYEIPAPSSIITLRDKIMSKIRNKNQIENRLYENELSEKYLGHITFYDNFGMIIHEKTIKIQCEALSDNRFLNSELSDWDRKMIKDGGWVMPKIK
jgi:hypothetical protein